jgi:BolA-like protein 1
MVYALLKEEMAREGGIHALELRTRTPKEDEEAVKRKKEESDTAVEDIGVGL